MHPSQIYIIISLIVLAGIAIPVLYANKNKKQKRLSPLAGLAFVCVLAGLFFGGERIIGYSLFCAGIGLAVIDIIKKSR